MLPATGWASGWNKGSSNVSRAAPRRAHGASAAVQLVVARGAHLIGTASPANHDYPRSLGAEPVAYGEGLVERVRARPTASTPRST
jgi:hypothetical protein